MTRLAYSRRKDEMAHYYAMLKKSEDAGRRLEEVRRRAVKAMRAKNWTLGVIAKPLGAPCTSAALCMYNIKRLLIKASQVNVTGKRDREIFMIIYGKLR